MLCIADIAFLNVFTPNETVERDMYEETHSCMSKPGWTDSWKCNITNWQQKRKAVICDSSTWLRAETWIFWRYIPATARKKHPAKAYTVRVSHGIWSDRTLQCDELDVSLHGPGHFKTFHIPQNKKQKVCTTHHLTIQFYPTILITLYFVEYSFQHCAAWLSLAKLNGY